MAAKRDRLPLVFCTYKSSVPPYQESFLVIPPFLRIACTSTSIDKYAPGVYVTPDLHERRKAASIERPSEVILDKDVQLRAWPAAAEDSTAGIYEEEKLPPMQFRQHRRIIEI